MHHSLEKTGTPHSHGHAYLGGPTRSVSDSAAETPIPREPDGANMGTTSVTQKSGAGRRNIVRFEMKEAEAARHSGHCYPHPSVHIARSLLSVPEILRGNRASNLRA